MTQPTATQQAAARPAARRRRPATLAALAALTLAMAAAAPAAAQKPPKSPSGATPAPARALAAAAGAVTDDRHRPLPGALVVATLADIGAGAAKGSIGDTDAPALAQALTDDRGRFRLPGLPAGARVTLTATFLGHDPAQATITAGDPAETSLALARRDIMFDEVVVAATRATSQMPVTHSTLTRAQVAERNAGVETPLMLALMPSVVATSEGGAGIGNAQLRIRGVDPSRINVTIDGVPVNDGESQSVFWVNMPDLASSVDDAQVQRGVGTSGGGTAAFGGAVNLRTRAPQATPHASLDLAGGAFSTLRATATAGSGLLAERLSVETRVTRQRSDGYVRGGGSDHKGLSAAAALQGAKSRLKLNILHGEQHTGITWEGTPGHMLDIDPTYNPAGLYHDDQGNELFYSDQKDNYRQTHYHLTGSRQLGGSLTASATLHLTTGEGYYEEYKEDKAYADYALAPPAAGGDTAFVSDFVQQEWMDNVFYGAVASAAYDAGRGLQAAAGGGWNRMDGDHFGRLLWAERGGADIGHEYYRNNGLKDDWNLFAKALWTTGGGRLRLFGDMQLRGVAYRMAGPDKDQQPLDQSHRWLFANPKAGAVWRLAGGGELQASVGMTHREPARADLKDALKGGQKHTPRPERLVDIEAGYRLAGERAAVEANLYYMRYKDQLVATGRLSDAGYALMDNVERSYRAGVELIAGAKVGRRLRLDANATLSRNRILGYTDYVDLYDSPDAWNPLPQQATALGDTEISFSPAVVGAAIATIDAGRGFSLSWESKYVGRQYLDNTSSPDRRLPAYWVNNLRAGWRGQAAGARALYAQLSVNNILDARYASSAWVYRARFATGGEYREDGYYPQAGVHLTARVGFEF